MGALLGVYLLGLVVCLVAGVALGALLKPAGRWIGIATVPLGLCVLITLLYPIGAVLPGFGAAWVTLALVVAGLAAGAVLRLRRVGGPERPASLAAALRPEPRAVATIAGGALAGVLILVPTMKQGFATTIAASNNDGWGYATLVNWLKHHPFPRDVAPDIAEPLTFVPWTTDKLGFGFGFERFAALLGTVLQRPGFEVVNAAAAVGVAAAVGGWIMLAVVLRPRLGPPALALAGLAVASPLLVLPFVENYTTQFVSLCLWPFAAATFAGFALAPGWRRLLVAAVASGAVVGVYPSTALWLVVPIGIVALLLTPEGAWSHDRLSGLRGPGAVPHTVRAALSVAAFALAVVVVAPIQVVRGVQNLLVVDSAPSGGLVDFFSPDGYAALVLGGVNIFALFEKAPIGWPTIAALGLLGGVLLLSFASPGRVDARRAVLLAVSGAVLLTTLVIFARYRFLDDRPYQVYKGLISGGAVLAGLVVLQLVPGRTSRARAIRLIAVGCAAAIWIPVTSRTLEASVAPGTGFRAADVEMGRAVADLPAGSTLLVEGAATDARSFQYRMMASYFAGRAGVRAVGLGSTASYLTPGGLAEWRPRLPWTHVLATGPQPIATDRRPIWLNGLYALSEAPTPDVTPYGSGWYPTELDGTTAFAWTAGPVELVVANRSARTMRVRLAFRATSFGAPRAASLSAGRRTVRRVVPAGALVPVGIGLTLPPRSTTAVRLDARPGAAVAPDGRRVALRIQDVGVTPSG